MATFTNETFTAANGTTVQSLSGWAEHPVRAAGELQIQSNRAYASAQDALVYHSGTSISADYSVEATLHVVSLPTSTRNGPVGRVNTTDETYYEFVYMTNGARWRLSRVVAGALLEIGSYSQTLTPGNSYVAKLELAGTTIKGYVDGVERVAAVDSAAPITAAGKVGYKHGGAAVTTTTGLHVDSLIATDASAPDVPITYVGVGTADAETQGDLTPTLPSGLVAGDLMLLVVYNKGGNVNNTLPSGWTIDSVSTSTGGKMHVVHRFYQAGDVAPVVAVTSTGNQSIAQVAGFRGVDSTTPMVLGTPTASDATGTTIGPITGITPAASKEAVVVVAGFRNDWTSVATLSGEALTWNEIAEPAFPSFGVSMVWDYAILPGDPLAISAKTFTVTGDTAPGWRGVMLSLRPAITVAAPATEDMRVKIAGVFTSAKSVKRRAAGVFATKPMRVVGLTPPPPPPPPVEPVPYTLPTVSSTDQATALTYAAGSPNTAVIFRVSEADRAQPLSYVQHSPTGPTGMRILTWCGLENVVNGGLSEARLATLKENGFDGFHFSVSRLPGNGGPSPAIWTQRLTDAKNFANAHPEFKCTVGITMAGTPTVGNWTPFREWTIDADWNNIIIPGLQDVAHAIDDSALVGLGLDGEDYGQMVNGVLRVVRNGWIWSPGLGSEATIRAKVKERGAQVADTMCDIAGPIDITEYYLYFKPSTRSLAVEDAGGEDFTDRVSQDWIDGVTSDSRVTFRFIDSYYYKPDRRGGFATFQEQYAYDQAAWDGDARTDKPNSFRCPFIWITEGPKARAQRAAGQPITASDRQYSVSEVTAQLEAARQFTKGSGEFALYDQNYLHLPVYEPYFPAIKSAST